MLRGLKCNMFHDIMSFASQALPFHLLVFVEYVTKSDVRLLFQNGFTPAIDCNQIAADHIRVQV